MRISYFLPALFASAALAQLTPQQVKEQVIPTVAMVVASRPTSTITTTAAAVAVHSSGILLVPYALLRDANAVQVRFQSGEVFDDVQMLGVDERRGVAAIKIAGAVKVRPTVLSDTANTGDGLTVVSHLGITPWSSAPASFSSLRIADEVPGVGSGFKIIQFKAATAGGSNSAILFDSQARLIGISIGAVVGGEALNVAIPVDSVAGLTNSPVSRRFVNGASMIPAGANGNAPRAVPQVKTSATPPSTPGAPERSDALAVSKDKDFIVRNFKTMFIDAREAKYFDAAQLRAQLGRNKDFAKLDITIVEDRNLADTVLEVGYTFAWDYPFTLKHQNSSIVLLSGKGVGPMSGIAGAANVASQFSKATKPFRQSAQKKK